MRFLLATAAHLPQTPPYFYVRATSQSPVYIHARRLTTRARFSHQQHALRRAMTGSLGAWVSWHTWRAARLLNGLISSLREGQPFDVIDIRLGSRCFGCGSRQSLRRCAYPIDRIRPRFHTFHQRSHERLLAGLLSDFDAERAQLRAIQPCKRAHPACADLLVVWLDVSQGLEQVSQRSLKGKPLFSLRFPARLLLG